MTARIERPTLPPAVQPEWRGETYHGRPLTKASSFDWKVSFYVAVVGIAGAAQVIAAVARRQPGAEELTRRARVLALAGSAIGPMVLIQHLKTTSRWFNMLRIVRPTSPMSVGSWLLTAFGGFSGITALGDLLGRRWPFARYGAPDSIFTFLSSEPANSPCAAKEICVYEEDRLLAVSYFDVGSRSVSGVYAMFDPAITHRGLGIFTMLKEIEYSIETNRQYYYQGYAYEGESFYDYKKRFRATEVFDWDGSWVDF
ncbi:polysulfide reductase NrfD [Leptolyngbya sp. 15MV]|nr:polysulfide reductase NrfD [Leptolyngbya sp. 15MV]